MSAACTHDVVYGGLCVICGEEVNQITINQQRPPHKTITDYHPVLFDHVADPDELAETGIAVPSPSLPSSCSAAASLSHVPLVVGARTLHLTNHAYQSQLLDNMSTLLKQKKLMLVLDIDHTLVHTTDDPRVEPLLKDPSYVDLHSFTLPAEQSSHIPSSAAASHKQSRIHHFVSLRPHLKDFLSSLSSLYDLHIYTMGSRPYAERIMKLVDPHHHLTKHRVVTRTETLELNKKVLERLYACDESMCLIVDDRVDVWEKTQNVVRVFEYRFFGTREIYDRDKPIQDNEMIHHKQHKQQQEQVDHHPPSSLPSPSPSASASSPPTPSPTSLSPADRRAAGSPTRKQGKRAKTSVPVPLWENNQESASSTASPSPLSDQTHAHGDGTGLKASPSSATHLLASSQTNTSYLDNVLLSILSVLRAAHILFYSQFPSSSPHLPLSPQHSITAILARIRSTVLSGCHVLFSGVVPAGENPHTSEVGKLALTFGATIADSFDQRVTHVVAARDGSEKVKQALALPASVRPHLVHLAWLYHCTTHYQRSNETSFPVQIQYNQLVKQNTPDHIPRLYVEPHLIQHAEPVITEGELIRAVQKQVPDGSRTNNIQTKEVDDIKDDAMKEEENGVGGVTVEEQHTRIKRKKQKHHHSHSQSHNHKQSTAM